VAQINAAMGQLNQTTQQNASASEELAATAEEMSSQSENLQHTMMFFKLADAGGVVQSSEQGSTQASAPAGISARRSAAQKPGKAKAGKAAAAAVADEQDFSRF